MGTQWWVGNRRRPVRGCRGSIISTAPMGEYETARTDGVTLSGLLLRCAVPPHPHQMPYNTHRSDSDIYRRQIPGYRSKGFLALSVMRLQDILSVFKIRYTTTTATTAAQPTCHPRHLHASDSRIHSLCVNSSILPRHIYYLDSARLSHVPSRPERTRVGTERDRPLFAWTMRRGIDPFTQRTRALSTFTL